MKITANIIVKALQTLADKEKVKILSRFFKTGKGEYGEGDLFLGIKVPDTRSVAKEFAHQISFEEIDLLLQNPYHEVRLCALLILVEQFKKGKKGSIREEIVQFYLAHTPFINNWDLVDLSCPKIIGNYLIDNPDKKSILYQLIESEILWEQRIAVVSTWALIHEGDIDDIFILAEKIIYHSHDLMRKATGWMLREAAKKEKGKTLLFLNKYAKTMPRTTLRYAIEKFSPEEKEYYMNLSKK